MLAGSLSPSAMKRAYGAFLIAVGVYFLVGTRSTPAPAPIEPVAPAVAGE
jgi:hypothetical protein